MNINPQLTADFRLVIPGLEEVNYFCQRAPLPGIHQPAVMGGWQNNNTRIPGETIQYDPLTVDFIVDEDLKNFTAIQDWLRSHKLKDEPMKRTRDIALHVLNRNKKSTLIVTFFNAFPTDVEPLSFDHALGDAEVAVCSTTFEYQYYTYEFKQ